MGRVGSIESWARPRHSGFGVVATLLLSLATWPLLAGAAHGPGVELPRAVVASAVPAATLTRDGDEVIITGSVAALFTTGVFFGPNRAMKVNRARLTPDGVTVSGGFDAFRQAVAEARRPKRGIGDLEDSEAAVKVASIDPSVSAALVAIDQVVAMPVMPVSASVEMAYARETTPATDFNRLVDRSGKEVSEKELWCMATAIYFEARGESYRGQVAVGQVVLNRVAHRLYPGTICNVVFQNQHMRNACQFSFACDGIPETVTEPKSWAQAEEIARGVINGSLYLSEVGKSTHYHATYVHPYWAPRLKKNVQIGQHIFYQFKRA